MCKRNIPFLCYKKIGSDIWFPADNWNALYRYNIETRRTEWVGSFPNEIFRVNTLFWDMQIYNAKIFFIPYAAEKLHIYDIKQCSFESLAIPTNLCGPQLFTQGIVNGDFLYLIGYGCRGILRLDFNTYTFEIINHWIKELDKQFGIDKEQGLIGRQSAVINHKLYMPCSQKNVIIEYNLHNNCYQFHVIGNEKNKYVSVHHLGEILLLVTFGQTIVLWNKSLVKEIKLQMDVESTLHDKMICYKDEELWLFSTRVLEYLKVDIRNNGVKTYEQPNKNDDFFSIVIELDNRIYFSTYIDGEWYQIDEHNKIKKLSGKVVEPRSTGTLLSELMGEICSDYVLYEQAWYPLVYLINKTILFDDRGKLKVNELSESKRRAGEKIHYAIKGMDSIE